MKGQANYWRHVAPRPASATSLTTQRRRAAGWHMVWTDGTQVILRPPWHKPYREEVAHAH